MKEKSLNRVLHTSSIALALSLAVVACVGDESNGPSASSADAGPGGSDATVVTPTEAGSDANSDATTDGGGDANAPLPKIDSYSISKTAFAGTKTECVNKADAAMKAMGGNYVLAGGGSSFARYADRDGAIVVATCLDDAAMIVTQAWAIKSAADTTNDESRLKNLVFDTTAPPVSAAASGMPKIKAAERVRKVSGLALSTCQNRGKAALEAMLAKAPSSATKWSKLGGNFVAAGGTDGSTGSITCLGDASGSVVLDVFTVDPSVTADSLLEMLDAAFTAAG